MISLCIKIIFNTNRNNNNFLIRAMINQTVIFYYVYMNITLCLYLYIVTVSIVDQSIIYWMTKK